VITRTAQASESAKSNKEKKIKVKRQDIVLVLQYLSVVLGIFVGLIFQKYVDIDFWEKGFHICVIIAVAWAVVIIWWRLMRDVDRSVGEIKEVRNTCGSAESHCAECINIIRRINDSYKHDDTQLIESKKVIRILREPSEDNNYTCAAEISHKIRNYSEHTLEKYIYELRSDAKMEPVAADFKTTIQKENGSDQPINMKLSQSEETSNGTVTRYMSNMEYDVEIMPGTSAVLTLKYNSSSFNGLFKHNGHEYTGSDIRYKTHEMEIVVELGEDMAKKYNLSMSTGDTHNWSIKDLSHNNMRAYELEISDSDQLPKLSSDKKSMIWRVKNPKIACSFRLKFSLEKI